MKKALFTLVSLLSLLIMATGTVFAAPLGTRGITLREVRNDPGGNVIFVFDISGDFSKSDFKGGSVFMGDQKFDLGCNMVDAETVQCTTSKATSGQYVTINVAGFSVYVRVPERGPAPSTSPSEYCYNVYDFYYDEDEESYYWKKFATHCQNTPANFGDVLDDFYNPDYDDYYDYEFLPNSPGCFDPVNENAYYFVCGL